MFGQSGFLRQDGQWFTYVGMKFLRGKKYKVPGWSVGVADTWSTVRHQLLGPACFGYHRIGVCWECREAALLQASLRSPSLRTLSSEHCDAQTNTSLKNDTLIFSVNCTIVKLNVIFHF